MWIRKEIDIGWLDLWRAIAFSIKALVGCSNFQHEACERLPSDGNSLQRAHGTLEFLSVRSGFDCVLRSLNFPVGSEILFSGLTIGDMPRIAIENGCAVVPIDISPDSLCIKVKHVSNAITPRTRAIVVANLFGSQSDLTELARIAVENDLFLIEDCAQGFIDSQQAGSPFADVSMFSFGPIKTNTALGGATFYFRSEQLKQDVHSIEIGQPKQSEFEFLRRVMKYLILKAASSKQVLSGLYYLSRQLNLNFDETISSMARGFSGHDFFQRIRRRPSIALRQLLRHRLRRFDHRSIELRAKLGDYLHSKLDDRIFVPGHTSLHPSYWVFAVMVRQPDALVQQLNRKGFDATRRSSLRVAQSQPPANHQPNRDRLKNAHEILDHIVFLPLSLNMSRDDLDLLAALVNETCTDPTINQRQFSFELTQEDEIAANERLSDAPTLA